MTVWLLAATISALSIQSQTAFDRITLAPTPSLADSAACVQTQAAAIAVATPEELPLLYFRRGFCSFAGATVTGDSREYLAAASDFDKVIETWPGRFRKRKLPVEPVPNALRALPWIARLHGAGDPGPVWDKDATPLCNSYLMTDGMCANVHEAARQWLGWLALGQGRLDDAARLFQGSTGSGWEDWAEGQRQFAMKRYAEAIPLEQRAIEVWRRGPTTLERRLGPKPDLASALADLGGAQLLAGDAKAAIVTLNEAVKRNPSNAQALYRRARAHDVNGEPAAALADYNLASRAAFAATRDLASGEAHLYRGVFLYKRQNYAEAEDEFASALNFEVAGPLRADAQAWRHLAAVASGSCSAAKDSLDRALPSVSPYFPTPEARKAEANCR